MSLSCLLAACGTQTPTVGTSDPYETSNRQTHEANLKLDRAVIKPVSTAYGTVVPNPVRIGVSNVSETLGLPSVVINDVLQFQLGDALHNTARFALNATFGIGGLFDPATIFGLEERNTGFADTLHAWGTGEGNYLVLPVYGPSTERDTVGLLVDIALDPIGSVLDPSLEDLPLALKFADIADTRYRYSDLYESVIYDSADSYVQLRLTYLDRRRFELGVKATQDATPDQENQAYSIYEDFYE
ncbi:MlaA family lipoprotein [Pacificibacter maritimus]|nr:VacJ family lipoprotein [Pacificibacter maritimus]